MKKSRFILNRLHTCSLFFYLLLSVFPSNVFAQEFGRFFTTADQRQKLDELKQQDPGSQIQFDESDLFIEQEPVEVSEEIQDSIKLKGLVYRNGGKSAAWVNESNSFEGDAGTGYIGIEEENIGPSEVQVTIPGSEKSFDLKVGQQYEPESEQVIDANVNLPQKVLNSGRR